MKKFSYLIILFFCFTVFRAQQPAHFFLGEKVFSGVQVYDVIQDNDFNYWFATDQGFYFFDGYEFKKIKGKNLKGEAAFGFVKSNDGNIYCHNLNGQIIQISGLRCELFYELKNDELGRDVFLETTPDGSVIVFSSKIIAITKGREIKIISAESGWYGFPLRLSNGQIAAHCLGSDQLYLINGTSARKISFNGFKIHSNDALVLFERNNQIGAINPATKEMYTFDLRSNQFSEGNIIKGIDPKEYYRYYKAKNKLWLAGTKTGVSFLNEENTATSPYFKDYLISDVFEDTEGNLLFSTFNNGVIVVPDLNVSDALDIPGVKSVMSLALVNGKLGIGSLKGEFGLYKNGTFKLITDKGSKPVQRIYTGEDSSIILYDDGKVRIYNDRTGQLFTGDFDVPVKDAVMIGNDTVIYGTSGSLILLNGISKAKNIQQKVITGFHARVYALDYSPIEKTLFIATKNGLITYSNNSFSEIRANNVSVFANDIYCYKEYTYVAGNGGKLFVFKNGELVTVTELIVNRSVTEIIKMKIVDDRIYALTGSGFVIFNLSGKVLHQLNKAYGFSTNAIFDFAVQRNNIWIVHAGGVESFQYDKLSAATDVPGIRLLDVHINDSLEVMPHRENVFDYNSRKFYFNFSSASIRNKENIIYHFKLVGYDKNWIQQRYDDHFVTYNGLAPGEYNFLLKAENRGVYSKEISFSFVIRSPFYFRPWFIGLCILVAASFIYAVYRTQLNKQRRKSEIINEINLSKLAAIQSQMNPHFIFNALNSIQDLVLKGDVEKSYTYISKFSDLIRRTLNYSDKDFISFDQELKLLVLYLTLEELRYNGELIFKIQSDAIEEKENLLLPPMLIQPFIENALVHGLLHKEHNKKLTVSFYLEKELICIVEDNGIGRERAKEIRERQRAGHESFSGKAIKKRFAILKEQYGGELGFEYEDLLTEGKPCGTRVVLKIPFRRAF